MDQPTPTQAGADRAAPIHRRGRRSGTILIVFSLLLLPVLSVLPLPMTETALVVASLLILLSGTVGVTLLAWARGRSLAWGLVGLVPYGGPLGVLLATGLDALLVDRAAKPARSALFAIVAAGGPLLLVVAVAPSYLRYGKRAVYAEVRTNLGAIYVAERMFYGTYGRYGTLEEIGFTVPGAGHRYTYRIDGSGRPGTIIPARSGQTTPDNSRVAAGYGTTGFTATATADIDTDPTLDQWHVNDVKCCLDRPDVSDVND